MSCACRMEQPKPNEPCFVFDLHDVCLFEECAWQVELFFVCDCTSPDDACLKGGCVVCEGKAVCVL